MMTDNQFLIFGVGAFLSGGLLGWLTHSSIIEMAIITTMAFFVSDRIMAKLETGKWTGTPEDLESQEDLLNYGGDE